MKKILFPALFIVTIFIFAVLVVSENLHAATSLTAVKAEKLDKAQVVGMIRPTLEKYLENHPDSQVRIWSMVVLANLDKIDEQQLSSVPLLVVQLNNKDENVRQIALNSLRASLTLDEKEWKGIMGTVFRTIAKKEKQLPEVKKMAIKSLGMLQDLDEESLNSLALLFELAQDDDADIRQAANEAIVSVLSAKETMGGAGGMGGGPAGM